MPCIAPLVVERAPAQIVDLHAQGLHVPSQDFEAQLSCSLLDLQHALTDL